MPAKQMKAKREHRVPLSQAAVDLLKALPYATRRLGLARPERFQDAQYISGIDFANVLVADEG